MTKIPVNALYTRRIEGGIKFEVEVATVAFSALFGCMLGLNIAEGLCLF